MHGSSTHWVMHAQPHSLGLFWVAAVGCFGCLLWCRALLGSGSIADQCLFGLLKSHAHVELLKVA